MLDMVAPASSAGASPWSLLKYCFPSVSVSRLRNRN